MAQFSKKEKELINNGTPDTPFRVLTVDNENDLAFLRKKSVNIDYNAGNKDLQLLIERLKLTMEIESGVGIAAPQIGIAKNIFLFIKLDNPDYPVIAAINPKIIAYPEETVCFERDGCLSIPEISGNSLRYPWVDVEYTDEYGNIVRERLEGYSRAGNFTGVIFQHEFDHLQGILYTDKLCSEPEI